MSINMLLSFQHNRALVIEKAEGQRDFIFLAGIMTPLKIESQGATYPSVIRRIYGELFYWESIFLN